MAKAQYSKPASELDLEARQKKDYQPSSVVGQAQDPQVSDNGYVAVDPIYQNHANDTEAPVKAEGGAEAKVFEDHLAEDADFGGDEDKDEEESSSSPSGSSTPSSSNPT